MPDTDADAIYLPGGYPELHAGRLAAAERFLSGLRGAAAAGTAVFGEGGGGHGGGGGGAPGAGGWRPLGGAWAPRGKLSPRPPASADLPNNPASTPPPRS